MADEEDPLTFGELRDALMPPGTDKDALWSALKGSEVKGPAKAELLGKIAEFHRTGGYQPGAIAPDPTYAPVAQQCGTTCGACDAIGIKALHVPHGEECRMVQASAANRRLAGLPSAPAGMTPGQAGALAMHESFRDLLYGGFTEDQALTIIARAFAAGSGE